MDTYRYRYFPVVVAAEPRWAGWLGEFPREAAVRIEGLGLPRYGWQASVGARMAAAELYVPVVGDCRRRLGAGRSVVADRLHVKGVGRTPLCGGWTDHGHGHSTGHMFPSLALREYVTSEYLSRLGLRDRIVPTIATALLALDACDRAVVSHVAEPTARGLSALDASHRACAVRPATSPRHGTLFAALGRMRRASHAPSVIGALLGGDADGRDMPEPGALVLALGAAAHRSLQTITELRRRGVFLGSVRDNLTLAGDLFDFEMAIIADEDCDGIIEYRYGDRPVSQSLPMGFEVLRLAEYWSFTVIRLRAEIDELVACAQGPARDWLAAFGAALSGAEALDWLETPARARDAVRQRARLSDGPGPHVTHVVGVEPGCAATLRTHAPPGPMLRRFTRLVEAAGDADPRRGADAVGRFLEQREAA